MDKEKVKLVLGRHEHAYLTEVEKHQSFEGLRILITGANGSIGTRLVERLNGLCDILPTDIQGDLVNLDVTDFEAVIKICERYNPTHIIHLAGAKHAPEGEVNPMEVCTINAIGTHNLIEAANARIVLSSTCKSCDPETAYGASKLLAERMVMNSGGSVARFYNVIETQGNVFEIWDNSDIKRVTTCNRFFISLDEAVGLTIYSLFNKGRFCVNTNNRYVPFIFESLYPNVKYDIVERRRGDRMNEPLHASSEDLLIVNESIFKINNYHDKSSN